MLSIFIRKSILRHGSGLMVNKIEPINPAPFVDNSQRTGQTLAKMVDVWLNLQKARGQSRPGRAGLYFLNFCVNIQLELLKN